MGMLKSPRFLRDRQMRGEDISSVSVQWMEVYASLPPALAESIFLRVRSSTILEGRGRQYSNADVRSLFYTTSINRERVEGNLRKQSKVQTRHREDSFT